MAKDYESYVTACYQRMYAAFERDRQSIEPHRLIDVRYEDLKANPVECLREIYETLHLSDFETVRPSIEQWVEAEHRASTNRIDINVALNKKHLIRNEWHDYFRTLRIRITEHVQ